MTRNTRERERERERVRQIKGNMNYKKQKGNLRPSNKYERDTEMIGEKRDDKMQNKKTKNADQIETTRRNHEQEMIDNIKGQK